MSTTCALADEKNATISMIQDDAGQRLAEIEAIEQNDAKDEDEEDDDDEADKASRDAAAESSIPSSGLEDSNNSPSTDGALNDDDARCYSARYTDIDALLDPRAHFSTTGVAQGRLGTCAKRLTDYEAQRYLD